MSGHSKWSTIKHQKAVTDVRRGRIFSKMAKLVALAAQKGGDPNLNPSLRLAIEKAKAVNMPNDNIRRAIKKGTGEDKSASLEEIIYEAYGPGGAPLIIKTITDNKNRTVSEIKHLLQVFGGKLAEMGSVQYLFTKEKNDWVPKYPAEVNNEKQREQLKKLFEALEEQEDVEEVYFNVTL